MRIERRGVRRQVNRQRVLGLRGSRVGQGQPHRQRDAKSRYTHFDAPLLTGLATQMLADQIAWAITTFTVGQYAAAHEPGASLFRTSLSWIWPCRTGPYGTG